MVFVTGSNRRQPLWQPPPTACLTASRAITQASGRRVDRKPWHRNRNRLPLVLDRPPRPPAVRPRGAHAPARPTGVHWGWGVGRGPRLQTPGNPRASAQTPTNPQPMDPGQQSAGRPTTHSADVRSCHRMATRGTGPLCMAMRRLPMPPRWTAKRGRFCPHPPHGVASFDAQHTAKRRQPRAIPVGRPPIPPPAASAGLPRPTNAHECGHDAKARLSADLSSGLTGITHVAIGSSGPAPT